MFVYILELLNGAGPQAFFDLSKGQKRHQCPLFKEAGRESGEETGKGTTSAPQKPDKQAPKTPTTPSTIPITSSATTPSQGQVTQAKKKLKKMKPNAYPSGPKTLSSA
jgi:hypothetical protein